MASDRQKSKQTPDNCQPIRGGLNLLALFTLVLWGSLSAAQVHRPICDGVLGGAPAAEEAPVSYTSRISKLTLADAKKIVGTARFGENYKLVKKVVEYIKKQPYESVDHVIADLDVLFLAVYKRAHDWEYESFRAHDGSIGFIGTIGHVLIVRKDGEIFKGRIDRRRFTVDHSARIVDYDELHSVGKVKIQPPAASNEIPTPAQPSTSSGSSAPIQPSTSTKDK